VNVHLSTCKMPIQTWSPQAQEYNGILGVDGMRAANKCILEYIIQQMHA